MAGNLPGQGQVPQSQGHMGAFITMARNAAMPGTGVMTTAGQDMNMGKKIAILAKLKADVQLKQPCNIFLWNPWKHETDAQISWFCFYWLILA